MTEQTRCWGQPGEHVDSQLCLFVDLEKIISINHMDSQNTSINQSDSQLCLLVDQRRNPSSINQMDSQLCLFVDRKRNPSSITWTAKSIDQPLGQPALPLC
jgi:hypothetical protein